MAASAVGEAVGEAVGDSLYDLSPTCDRWPTPVDTTDRIGRITQIYARCADRTTIGSLPPVDPEHPSSDSHTGNPVEEEMSTPAIYRMVSIMVFIAYGLEDDERWKTFDIDTKTIGIDFDMIRHRGWNPLDRQRLTAVSIIRSPMSCPAVC